MKSEYSIAEAFQVLELPHGASLEVAEAAYRKLAVQVHPDRFQNNSKMRSHAEEEQRKLNEAIRTLRIRLKENGHPSSETRSPEPEPPRPPRPNPTPTEPPQSESKKPPHPDPPRPKPDTEFSSPKPDPPPPSQRQKAPSWRTQMWGLFCAVFVIAKLVTTVYGWHKDAEPATSSPVVTADPASTPSSMAQDVPPDSVPGTTVRFDSVQAFLENEKDVRGKQVSVSATVSSVEDGVIALETGDAFFNWRVVCAVEPAQREKAQSLASSQALEVVGVAPSDGPTALRSPSPEQAGLYEIRLTGCALR